MPSLPIARSLVFLAIPLGAAAQTIHVVGPGSHAEITHALAVASAGDVVLVHPGTYQPFLLTLGLTVRALVPGTVVVLAGSGSAATAPAGQTANLVGLTFSWLGLSGRVTLDECTVIGGPVYGGCLWIHQAQVHLQSCVVRSLPNVWFNMPALDALQSEVTAIDSTFEGAAAMGAAYPSPAITLATSKMRCSHSTLLSGTGALNIPAAWGDGTSWLWLTDSVATASDPASCPLAVLSGGHARCTLTSNCSVTAALPLLGVSRLSPLQNGQPFALEFRTTPAGLLGVWASLELDYLVVPAFAQALLLPVNQSVSAGVYIADAQGRAMVTWMVPGGPAAMHQTLWLQAVGGLAYSLQASAVVGGVVR